MWSDPTNEKANHHILDQVKGCSRVCVCVCVCVCVHSNFTIKSHQKDAVLHLSLYVFVQKRE